MKPDAEDALNHQNDFFHPVLDDIRKKNGIDKFIDFYKNPNYKYPNLPIKEYKEVWLDIGAGSGSFFLEIAKHHTDKLLIAIERDRMRAKSLLKRAKKHALENLIAIRGNIIPFIVNIDKKEWLDRIFILYPCPWPKKRHRKNRWYFHPIMSHLVTALKTNGKIIWASDEKFYIEEAFITLEKYFGLKTISYGLIEPNSYNGFIICGRSKFEKEFFSNKKDCFELVVEKTNTKT